ncbi:MAG: CAP domain-containing protein [Deltaproteobacteria bacterium]|nr:CAP domain-containing protein [Deltaproteobacteria bacterium]
MLKRKVITLFIPLFLVAGLGCQPLKELDSNEQKVFDLFNSARTNPAQFAEDHLKTAYESGYDNGSYNDLLNSTPCSKLVLNDQLMEAAEAHSKDMASCDTLQHESCDGTTVLQRINSYYDGIAFDELIAFGFTGKEAAVAWIIDVNNSTDNRDAIMNCSNTEIGISLHNEYWTIVIGR